MKKLISLFSFVLLFTALSAQQIPNGSFRYWSSPLAPDGWGTWASVVSGFNADLGDSLGRLAVKDTTLSDYITDSATLRLTVDTATLPSQSLVTLAGFASLGGAYYQAPPLGVGLGFGYIPYTSKPDTFFMDYKYLPAPGFNDSAIVVLSLTKFDTLTHTRGQVMLLSILLTSTPQWQRNVAFPLRDFYTPGLVDTLVPDSLQLYFYSSLSNPPSRGTTLWVDSVHFDASVVPVVLGIPEASQIHGVDIYPNPADGRLQIGAELKEVGSTVRIYNAAGQQVYDGILREQLSAIDTHSLPAGIYTLRIASADRLTVYHSSVTIVHSQ